MTSDGVLYAAGPTYPGALYHLSSARYSPFTPSSPHAHTRARYRCVRLNGPAPPGAPPPLSMLVYVMGLVMGCYMVVAHLSWRAALPVFSSLLATHPVRVRAPGTGVRLNGRCHLWAPLLLTMLVWMM